jgi:mevalonate kinase
MFDFHSPGKLILLGEHFVVHGSPALAVPISAVQTDVRIMSGSGRLTSHTQLTDGEREQATRLFFEACRLVELQPETVDVEVKSNVPIGCGLGSSASFSVALVGAAAKMAESLARENLPSRAESRPRAREVGVDRSLVSRENLPSRAESRPLAPEVLRERAHQLEKIVHGAPSGIDDSVVALRRPIRFRRGEAIYPLAVARPIEIVLASAGKPQPTRVAVANVGERKKQDPARFSQLVAQASDCCEAGQAALESGDSERLGAAMDRNHALLQEVGVSTPLLDSLVAAAKAASALGAKLTGAGLGGYCVALARDTEHAKQLIAAFAAAGGENVFSTRIDPAEVSA